MKQTLCASGLGEICLRALTMPIDTVRHYRNRRARFQGSIQYPQVNWSDRRCLHCYVFEWYTPSRLSHPATAKAAWPAVYGKWLSDTTRILWKALRHLVFPFLQGLRLPCPSRYAGTAPVTHTSQPCTLPSRLQIRCAHPSMLFRTLLRNSFSDC